MGLISMWIKERLQANLLQEKNFNDNYKVEELEYKVNEKTMFLYVLYRYNREGEYITGELKISLNDVFTTLLENLEIRMQGIPTDNEDYMARWK